MGCIGSRREIFHPVLRTSRGAMEVNAPGKLMDALERHCAALLQPSLPAILFCLSHVGQFKAMRPREDRGF